MTIIRTFILIYVSRITFAVLNYACIN